MIKIYLKGNYRHDLNIQLVSNNYVSYNQGIGCNFKIWKSSYSSYIKGESKISLILNPACLKYSIELRDREK